MANTQYTNHNMFRRIPVLFGCDPDPHEKQAP